MEAPTAQALPIQVQGTAQYTAGRLGTFQDQRLYGAAHQRMPIISAMPQQFQLQGVSSWGSLRQVGGPAIQHSPRATPAVITGGYHRGEQVIMAAPQRLRAASPDFQRHGAPPPPTVTRHLAMSSCSGGLPFSTSSAQLRAFSPQRAGISSHRQTVVRGVSPGPALQPYFQVAPHTVSTVAAPMTGFRSQPPPASVSLSPWPFSVGMSQPSYSTGQRSVQAPPPVFAGIQGRPAPLYATGHDVSAYSGLPRITSSPVNFAVSSVSVAPALMCRAGPAVDPMNRSVQSVQSLQMLRPAHPAQPAPTQYFPMPATNVPNWNHGVPKPVNSGAVSYM